MGRRLLSTCYSMRRFVFMRALNFTCRKYFSRYRVLHFPPIHSYSTSLTFLPDPKVSPRMRSIIFHRCKRKLIYSQLLIDWALQNTLSTHLGWCSWCFTPFSLQLRHSLSCVFLEVYDFQFSIFDKFGTRTCDYLSSDGTSLLQVIIASIYCN